MEIFKAGVQYGDFKGTAAADAGDDTSLDSYLRDKGALQEGDFLVGVSLWVGENHHGKAEQPFIRALIAPADGFDDFKASVDGGGELLLRKVDVKLELEEFVGLFKRFSVVLTKRGLDLEGREYRVLGE